VQKAILAMVCVTVLGIASTSSGQGNVTLQSTTSPAAGQSGVHNLTVTGSGFPTGTIAPANVQIRLEPNGGGTPTLTAASAVTLVVGSTRRVSFRIPAGIDVSAPTQYRAWLSGATNTGVKFASTNGALLTLNPPASLSSVNPQGGAVGQSVEVQITGSFTNFVQGSTMASFGADVSVGGAAAGAFGALTVLSPTSAKASLAIGAAAAGGSRTFTVRTGVQQATAQFEIITAPAPTIVATVTPEANAAGWRVAPVVVTYACQNATSCPDAVTLTSEGAGQNVTREATGPGGTASASVWLDIDRTPPSITATLNPPPNANGWHAGAVHIQYLCSDGASGIDTCPSDQQVSGEGANQTVSATAIDRAGLIATINTTVNIDLTPPVLDVASLPSDIFVAATALNASVSDALAGLQAVTCNGAAAGVNGTQASCDLSLAVGQNAIVVTATDRAGNETTSELDLNYIRAPKITLASPTHLSYLNISPTTITGTIDDPAATLTINTIDVPVTNGSFSMPLPIAEGPNIITASAKAGNAIGTASIEVTLDTTPPLVTVTSPVDAFTTTEESISVAGIVNDIVVGTVNDQDAQVTVNGLNATVANRTFLATGVPLQMGDNLIQVIARDRVGNSRTTEIQVRRAAATGPQIQLVSGNNQQGPIGSLLLDPLVIRLTNATGDPVANTPVVFKVMQNDGLITSTGAAAPTVIATTNAEGNAQAHWTLGNRSGAGGNVVEAYAVGFEGTAVFTATGTLGTPMKIVIDTGNDQIGAVDEPLPKPFIAVVVDNGNNRVAGVPVTFTVTAGGGDFEGEPTFTTVSDSDGRVAATLTLGLQEGNANNSVEATFLNNPGFPAVFNASARVPGDPAETTIAGVVLDNSNLPVPGVTVRAVLTSALRSSLIVVQQAIAVQTDPQGQFIIPQAPVGLVKLMVDGTTVTTPDGRHYPALEYDIVTVAGQRNDVGQPIYILPISEDNKLCVTESTGGGTLTVPEAPGFALTFSPGQVTFPGGSKSGCVSVTVVNGDKVPMVPGFGQQPRFVVTIQPAGAVFNPPAPITLPNVDGLPPRAVTEMYSFDHDIGSFVAIGTGVVSDDGLVISSSPGVGVLKAGWHCGGDPNTTGTAATCPTCQTCQGTQCVPDNGQTPPQTPNDCKRAQCSGGSVTNVNDDGDHDANTCCYQGETQQKQPITDLAKCPNRVQGPWTYQYDGCSLAVNIGGTPYYLPAGFRNNPAGGNSTLFSDAHLPSPTYQYACDAHDRCYQQCAGTDMVGGQEFCDLILRDIALGTCADAMLSDPGDVLSGAAAQCFVYAQAYYSGLSSTGLNLGKSAYEDRQRAVCKCC
jgi:hypothetical protein